MGCRGLECTGTLIGPKHVITAAHCVFDINDSHQYVSALNFAAGQNGNLQPYGQAAWATLRVVDQFTQQVLRLCARIAGALGVRDQGSGMILLNSQTQRAHQSVPLARAWQEAARQQGSVLRCTVCLLAGLKLSVAVYVLLSCSPSTLVSSAQEVHLHISGWHMCDCDHNP